LEKKKQISKPLYFTFSWNMTSYLTVGTIYVLVFRRNLGPPSINYSLDTPVCW